ncbi:MarR family winged helix-turn-helix transcriptional regulator [Amycolatopsis albispora]|uniref:MarR family transcriptional regulator n=1 Tax=Amycolatopsis albispora TaxID=1804986 RepID=A0A344KZD2_9PSEU|nr:MarR family transcriptional regulator [Amycolatopsis albispora]AXB41156.1 MarR family transcriptional regulator [Amycolatopsis albispora]
MAEGDRRPDLAAMLGGLMRRLMAAEAPVLEEHGLSMWGYVVLSALDDGPVRTQAALARAIGADKTRIIGTLDKLQDAGLISREPDPADRRVRVLAITAEGRARRRSAQKQIQAHEDELLAGLSDEDRAAFLRAARALGE